MMISAPKRSPPSTEHLLLQNRRKDLAPLLLETRIPLKTTTPQPHPHPLKDPFTSPPRRAHVRSNSTESWSTATPRSKPERTSRTQSGAWGSPGMYGGDVVAPLNVVAKSRDDREGLSSRRKRDEMQEINVGRDVEHDGVGGDGLKSPVWVPRLTPKRNGEDLFISVGWGGR